MSNAEPKSKMDEAQLIELIQIKVTTDSVYGSVMAAMALMTMLPTLRRMVHNLERLATAVDDEPGSSVSMNVKWIGNLLKETMISTGIRGGKQ